MDAQYIFNETIRHLVTQGRASTELGDPEVCLYRGPNKTSCAAGFWIKDEFYTPELECNRVHIDEVQFALEQSHPGITASDKNRELLFRLQRIHDDAAVGGIPFVEGVLQRSRILAEDLGLDTPHEYQ